MSLYQGRALVSEQRPKRRPPGGLKRIVRVVAAVILAWALTLVPWERWTAGFWVLTEARVEGHHYLEPDSVLAIAGLQTGQNLSDLDRDAIRQTLMLHPRIERAEVSRRGLRGLTVRVVERIPVLLVRHGAQWEMDSTGTLMEPMIPGVVADAPLLAGARFKGLPEGARIGSPKVRRGLSWARALADQALQLAGETSEIDVSEARHTTLLLLDGTRVLAPAWPPGLRDLSALRVVLSDLESRGTVAREIDMRFEDQVIVRPAEPVGGVGASPGRRVDGDEGVNPRQTGV